MLLDSSNLRQLRVSEAARLLNSTPMGTVIPLHRLYRHQVAAGSRIGKDRIDLIRYAAWLQQIHSEGGTLVGRRPRAKHTIANDGSVHKQSILALLERQQYRCALSGRALTPESACLDHIVPVSRGGEHRISNAQILGREVNRAKGTLSNDEFISLCRQVWRHVNRNTGETDCEYHI